MFEDRIDEFTSNSDCSSTQRLDPEPRCLRPRIYAAALCTPMPPVSSPSNPDFLTGEMLRHPEIFSTPDAPFPRANSSQRASNLAMDRYG